MSRAVNFGDLTASDDEDDEPLSKRQERKRDEPLSARPQERKRKAEKPVSSESEDDDEESEDDDEDDNEDQDPSYVAASESVQQQYGAKMIKRRVRIRWEDKWEHGKVKEYVPTEVHCYLVLYDDQEQQWHNFDEEDWAFSDSEEENDARGKDDDAAAAPEPFPTTWKDKSELRPKGEKAVGNYAGLELYALISIVQSVWAGTITVTLKNVAGPFVLTDDNKQDDAATLLGILKEMKNTTPPRSVTGQRQHNGWPQKYKPQSNPLVKTIMDDDCPPLIAKPFVEEFAARHMPIAFDTPQLNFIKNHGKQGNAYYDRYLASAIEYFIHEPTRRDASTLGTEAINGEGTRLHQLEKFVTIFIGNCNKTPLRDRLESPKVQQLSSHLKPPRGPSFYSHSTIWLATVAQPGSADAPKKGSGQKRAAQHKLHEAGSKDMQSMKQVDHTLAFINTLQYGSLAFGKGTYDWEQFLTCDLEDLKKHECCGLLSLPPSRQNKEQKESLSQ